MKHKQLIQRIRHWGHTHKTLLLRVGAVVAIIAAVGIIGLWVSGSSENVSRTAPDSESGSNEPEIKIVPSPLTGLSVEEKLANRPVTAVVIENSPNARPQSSLPEAGLVFESIAEGGITRFVVFYQESRPQNIGPVRSLRPYFIDWLLPFEASIAHVGGSQQALQEARQLNVRDLDQFAHAGTYSRVSDRFAPHNVYTDFRRLDALNTQLGYTSSEFDSWPRKEDEPLATPKARIINVPISSFLYNPEFRWQPDSNTYRRFQGGEPHVDAETNEQIAPKVVIVIRTDYSVESSGRYNYDLIGQGKATIFQDGKAIAGTWKKSSRSDMMTFVDSNNNAIQLNAGQVWISAISPDDSPEFKP